MPTNIRRARQLLRRDRAEIAGRRPFTIRLLSCEDGAVQPVEYKCDTGDHHAGSSICTEKRKLMSAQHDLLLNGPERPRDRAVNCGNRLKYRKSRFDIRKKPQGWLAPTLADKCNQYVLLYRCYANALPIMDVVMKMDSFDLQTLGAAEAGLPLPQKAECQHGPRHGYDTLREAELTRDKYACQVCGKGVQDGSNRMDTLRTVCTKCPTAKNPSRVGNCGN